MGSSCPHADSVKTHDYTVAFNTTHMAMANQIYLVQMQLLLSYMRWSSTSKGGLSSTNTLSMGSSFYFHPQAC